MVVFVGRDEGFRQSTHLSADLHSVVGWTEKYDEDYDYGVVRLAEPARVKGHFDCRALTDAELRDVTDAHVVGYPEMDRPLGTLWGMCGKIVKLKERLIRYEIVTSSGQSGGPVFGLDGKTNKRVAFGIHAYGDQNRSAGNEPANKAVRITEDVLANLQFWDALP